MTKEQALYVAILVADVLKDKTNAHGEVHNTFRNECGTFGEAQLVAAVQALGAQYGFEAFKD